MRRIILLVLFFSCSPKTSSYLESIHKFRIHYQQEFLNEERAPLKTQQEVDLLDFYEPDPDYSCNCSITVLETRTAFEMTTYSGITKPYYTYAIAICPLKGKSIKLQLYQSVKLSMVEEYKDALFLPFKDETNGDETYGGGRYLDLSTNDIQDGKINIDFNKCYNPWCAYSEGYNCPIPPKPNHLEMAVSAGEKNYKGVSIH